jgi:hypothetical protein
LIDSSEEVGYSIRKYIKRAKAKLREAKSSIVTSHLHLRVWVMKLDEKNPIMLPMHDIELQRPIDDPYFLECQWLLIRARIVCQIAKCENPYATTETAIIISNETMLRSFLMWYMSLSGNKRLMKGMHE